MYSKKEIVNSANGFFERNKEAMEERGCSRGLLKFCNFYDRCSDLIHMESMLEVGCSIGCNLRYMSKRYGIKGFGIDPSDKAVDYGNSFSDENVILKQGFSDELTFPTDAFEMVYLGFCLYQVSRDMLLKTIAESNRVLKQGGVLVVTDFDTPLNYIRENKHDRKIPTFKMDYSNIIQPHGYTLVYKDCFTHLRDSFDLNIQERCSTQVFYKEKMDDLYIKG